eukprot:scaffold4544_cov66-Phaeocystis_antarctica.AAC.3
MTTISEDALPYARPSPSLLLAFSSSRAASRAGAQLIALPRRRSQLVPASGWRASTFFYRRAGLFSQHGPRSQGAGAGTTHSWRGPRPPRRVEQASVAREILCMILHIRCSRCGGTSVKRQRKEPRLSAASCEGESSVHDSRDVFLAACSDDHEQIAEDLQPARD